MTHEPGIIRRYSMEEAIDVLKTTTNEDMVYVGCDSKNKKKTTTFAKVIVVHYKGAKGCKILALEPSIEPRYANRDTRLLTEVYYSCEIGRILIEAEAVELNRMQIHMDLNPDTRHKSNKVVNQAFGYTKSYGFHGVIKPDAIAASSASDYITRRTHRLFGLYIGKNGVQHRVA